MLLTIGHEANSEMRLIDDFRTISLMTDSMSSAGRRSLIKTAAAEVPSRIDVCTVITLVEAT